ncbi:hypothetical protein BD779DRAFT_1685313 [Infundibulicybe gibba]|nr:hypothetical protein BD779DRAFT_1685313 [Infundibulicybe gibba]
MAEKKTVKEDGTAPDVPSPLSLQSLLAALASLQVASTQTTVCDVCAARRRAEHRSGDQSAPTPSPASTPAPLHAPPPAAPSTFIPYTTAPPMPSPTAPSAPCATALPTPSAVTSSAPCATPPSAPSTAPLACVPSSSALPTDRWYTVTVGQQVGVFSGWSTVAPLVISVSGACFMRHSSQAAAIDAFNHAVASGAVRIVN